MEQTNVIYLCHSAILHKSTTKATLYYIYTLTQSTIHLKCVFNY